MKLRRFREGYRSFLPLFPHAISTLDLSRFDLVLSNTHCVAKGVRKKPGALHVAYVSTPMRYVWDMFDEYFGPGKTGAATSFAASMLRRPLQKWDVRSTAGVDALAANSVFVQKRIRDFWGRESTVIHPFVETARFLDKFAEPQGYYLIVSAFAPYKRVDLAIEACRRLGRRLLIVGKGQDEAKLRRQASGAQGVEFLGGLSNEALGELYRKAHAFLFPGLEDFGITPLESLYNGRPVIAYGQGGALDTVTEATGVFFPEQTVESLMEAIERFEAREAAGAFRPEAARLRALEFTRARFREQYLAFLEEKLGCPVS